MKKLNRAMGSLIRFLHIYQSMVIGTVILLGSAILMLASKDILVSASALTKIDRASFLPQIVFCALMGLSVIHFVNCIRQIKHNKETVPTGEDLEKRATQTLRSLAALGLLFLFVLLMKKVGFVITAILYMIAAMTFMTKKSDRKMLYFVIISVVMTLVVYFCFKKFLYIYLPNGILKGVF